MKPRRSLDLTSGPVLSRLLQFVLPILLSNLLQHFYNAADKIVVGQFAENGKVALAAVGAASPACSMLVTLLSGLSLGSTITCSNLKGARKHRELRDTMHTSVLMSLVVGVVLCLLGLVFSKPLLRAMSTPEEAIGMSTQYMQIYFLGVPFMIAYNFGAGILRANGDARRPMTILALSGLINVCLNLVFVIVFKMGAAGVALATAIAQVVSAVRVLWILFSPKDEYKLQFRQLHWSRHHAQNIIRLGVPCSMNGLVFSVSNVLVQTTVNELGPTILAGNVAADGITGLIYQVIIAFYSGCISFTGQCLGAKKYRRIDQMLLSSCACCLGVLIVVNIFSTLWPELVLRLFNDDPEVIAAGIPKLMIIGWGYLLYAASEIFLGTLRGLGKSNIPTIINVLSICGVRLIWIYGVYKPFLSTGVTSLYICYPLSYVFSVTALGIYLLHSRRQLTKCGEEKPETAKA